MWHNKGRRRKKPNVTHLLSWTARSAPRSFTALWEAERVEVGERLMRTHEERRGPKRLHAHCLWTYLRSGKGVAAIVPTEVGPRTKDFPH